ncbi:efflux RND transporter permease subunit [Saxibacter everestensis]|uniref:Efflux RND transporter permease subunit n=1 Tax=Saxibacter everestensis TaxID=2909229 RepID=A0ABY8QRJ7_9MICO|nr:efflux RND transporter permease subunit [Brevibacteriaceae bacterium ZFBP1038]
MSFLTRLSLANRALVGLVTLVIVGFGLFATTSLKQELFPSLQFPGASVVSSYPGAAPSSIQNDVTVPLEDAIKGVNGITKVQSTSSSGVSQISVQWDFGEDSDKIESDLRRAVSSVQTDMPQDVDPEVVVGSIDDIPVLQLAVSSEGDQAELARKMTTIALPKLRALDGVRDASLSGEQVRQVTIRLRADDVDKKNVDPASISEVLKANGVVVPAGSITADAKDLSVEVGNTMNSVKDLEAVSIPAEDDPVKLSDIADVSDEPVDESSLSRANGEPSLSLSVVKEQDGNTVDVAKSVRELLPDLKDEVGSGVEITTVFDQAPFIEQSIHDLSVEGGLGLLFAVLVILLFLMSLRSTIITAISIPLSLLIAMIGLWTGGYTLNILTLGALTVAVGRVVDDSIVVIENIKRHQGLGEKGAASIISAVREVSGAVTASTITTVAVFLPIAFVSGQTGELFRPFAVTVTIALLASLLVSLTVVPVLASWFMGRPSKPMTPARAERKRRNDEAFAARESARLERVNARAEAKLAKVNAKREQKGKDPLAPSSRAALGVEHAEHSSPQDALQRGYLPVLRAALRRPIVTLLIAVVLFVMTVGLSGQLKTDFIGEAGQNTLQITQEMPKGTSLEETDKAAKQVESILAEEDDVDSYLTTVGGGSAEEAFMGGGGGSNEASVSVTLKPDADGEAAATRLRDQVGQLEGAGEIEVATAGGAGAGSSDVSIAVEGQDDDSLREGSDAVAKMLGDIDGLSNVTSDLAERQSLLKVSVDKDEAAKYGFSEAQVGQAVSEALRGSNIGTITIDDKEQDLILKTAEAPKSMKDIENLELPVTQVQSAQAQKDAADEVEKKQEAIAERQQAKADEQAEEQADEIRKGRSEAQEQLDELLSQLQALQNGAGQPGQPQQSPEGQSQQAQAQQIAELRKAISQTREQIAQADEQLAAAEEAQQDQRRQQEESEQLADEQKDAAKAEADPKRVKDVATVEETKAPATITRIDGVRSVTVTATPNGDDLSAVNAAIMKGIDSVDLPDGVSAKIGGVSEEQNEAFVQLGLAMLVAIAIVYMVMVATFRSLLQPLILLVSIPFAATGALGLLLATGTPLGIPAMIGLLMLIGIVVTNAIVLIDLINQYRERGTSVDDAVLHGARLRLRPIVMTALATICALIPMSLGLTGGGVFISKPLAIVVIGGLISSTVLTLILVPVLYTLLERRRERRAARKAEQAEQQVEERHDPSDEDAARFGADSTNATAGDSGAGLGRHSGDA